jgi:hypothetical protein
VAGTPGVDSAARGLAGPLVAALLAAACARGAPAATNPDPPRTPEAGGRLAPEAILRILRAERGRFRLCFERSLRTSPNLQERVEVRFVIDVNGGVESAAGTGSGGVQEEVAACVAEAFRALKFPPPEGGKVRVVYPILFSPGD